MKTCANCDEVYETESCPGCDAFEVKPSVAEYVAQIATLKLALAEACDIAEGATVVGMTRSEDERIAELRKLLD